MADDRIGETDNIDGESMYSRSLEEPREASDDYSVEIYELPPELEHDQWPREEEIGAICIEPSNNYTGTPVDYPVAEPIDAIPARGHDGLQVLFATPVEPELVVFGVPSEAENNAWFRNKTVRNIVLANLVMMSLAMLVMAHSMLTGNDGQEVVDPLATSINSNLPNSSSTPSFTPTVLITLVETDSLYPPKTNEKFMPDIQPYSDVVDLNILMSAGTSQNSAWEWITRHDDFKPELFSDEVKRSRFIIVVLYFALNGKNWESTDKWLSGEHVCEWEHIICTNNTVSEILLPNQRLLGSLPDEITFLTSLKILNLTANHITGTIPYSIGRLARLEFVDFSMNDISSTIPKSIIYLVNLEHLRLNDNILTGTIPDSFSLMTKLRELLLFGNNLRGNIPSSIAKLDNMDILNLQNTDLTGVIPSEICREIETQHLTLIVDCDEVLCESCPFC